MRHQGCNLAMEEVVLSQEIKCFHHVHYLCSTREGKCIPQDSCPLEALAANLYITNVERRGDGAKISGTYDVMVWFKYGEGQVVGYSEKKVFFTVFIPLSLVRTPFIKTRLCVKNTKLDVLGATLEQDKKNICPGCGYTMKVEIEQEFMVFLQGLQPICQPASLVKEYPTPPIPSPTPTAPAIIKGRVLNKKGSYLFRAKIKVSDGAKSYFTRTNIEGAFFLPLYPDSYELFIAKTGYIAETLQLKLDSGEIKHVVVELEKEPRRKGLRLKF